MMVEVGKTEDEEQEELRRQIHNFENDPSVSIIISSSGFHQVIKIMSHVCPIAILLGTRFGCWSLTSPVMFL